MLFRTVKLETPACPLIFDSQVMRSRAIEREEAEMLLKLEGSDLESLEKVRQYKGGAC